MSLALLVTGAGGLLGGAMLDTIRYQRNAFARGLTSSQLDVADPFAVRDVVHEWARVLRADSLDHRLVVVNAAAYTAVDAAEADEEAAYAVNATGPALLARSCSAVGARLIHISTDYVFAGDARRPYEVEDEPAPRTAYGRTKWAGEQAVRLVLPDASWVVRTSWLYGRDTGFGATMARRAHERQTVDVVDDQTGSPTSSTDLAAALLALASSEAPPGTYHCTNRGSTTWYGLARAVFEELGADPALVRPTTTEAFPRPAPRPRYSVLSSRAWDAAGLPPMPEWRQALSTVFRAGTVTDLR